MHIPIVINRNKPINEDEGWLLLTQHVSNERTLLCYYTPNTNSLSIALFSKVPQQNPLSDYKSEWGWMTHFVNGIKSDDEATILVNQFLKDFNDGRFWWETSGMLN